jgi:hypothetical protein
VLPEHVVRRRSFWNGACEEVVGIVKREAFGQGVFDGEENTAMASTGDDFSSRVARLGPAVALAAVLAVGAGAGAAAAQGGPQGHDHDGRYGDHHDDGYDRRGGEEGRRVVAVNGYAEGYEHGVRDRRDRASFDYEHGGAYQRAMEGYDEGFGSERAYQDRFREGYARGYEDGYYGRSRSRDYERADGYDGHHDGDDAYGGYPAYRGTPDGDRGAYDAGRYADDREGDLNREEVARRAAQQGYYDGFERGQNDRRIGARRPKPEGHGAYQTALNGWDPEWGSEQTFRQTYRQYFMQGYEDGFGRRQMNRRYSRRWW